MLDHTMTIPDLLNNVNISANNNPVYRIGASPVLALQSNFHLFLYFLLINFSSLLVTIFLAEEGDVPP